MSYFAHLSVDALPVDDAAYKKIATELAALGLYDLLTTTSKETAQLPKGAFGGEFQGEGPVQIKNDLADRVEKVLSTNGIVGAMFLTVAGGGNPGWTWRRTTFVAQQAVPA